MEEKQIPVENTGVLVVICPFLQDIITSTDQTDYHVMIDLHYFDSLQDAWNSISTLALFQKKGILNNKLYWRSNLVRIIWPVYKKENVYKISIDLLKYYNNEEDEVSFKNVNDYWNTMSQNCCLETKYGGTQALSYATFADKFDLCQPYLCENLNIKELYKNRPLYDNMIYSIRQRDQVDIKALKIIMKFSPNVVELVRQQMIKIDTCQLIKQINEITSIIFESIIKE